MSGNIWAVLNNVADDTDNGKIKFKKDPNAKKKAQKKPAAAPTTTAAGGASGNKPQLTAKAARAFSAGQHAKKPKPKPQAAAQQQKKPASSGAAPAAGQQGPAMVVKKPTPAAAPASPVLQPAPAQSSAQSQQKIQTFQKALNSVLNGPSAFFQVSLMRSSEISVLQNNPYRVVGDMVKSPQFNTNLGLALKRDAKEFTKKDVRTRILGRVNRLGVAHHLLSLLTGFSPVNRTRSDEEAARIVGAFFEALWNIAPPPEPTKRPQQDRVEEDEAGEEDEQVGSAGNVKRDMTLSDFIKPAKVKGGKKGKAPQQTAAPAPAAAPAAVAAPAEPAVAETKSEAKPQQATGPSAPVTGTKEDPTTWRPDLLPSARELAKRIPSNIQCVRVEPSFLWSAEEVKASGKQQQYYFKNYGCDHVYAFWEDGKGDINFLITTGSA